MITEKENSKIRVLFAFVALNIFFINASYTADAPAFNENTERNWRHSLNLYDHTGEHLQIKADEWFALTFQAINKDNEGSLRGKFQKPTDVEQNIAAARFTIICRFDEKIKFFQVDLGKIFFSGLGSLNPDHKDVKGTRLLEEVVFPVSFIPGPRPTGPVIDRTQRDKVNHILGREVVNAGTHAEESIIITVFNNLKTYLGEANRGKPFLIIGTVLEISSLKDPCTMVCMPMLKAFLANLPTILQSKISGGITLAPQLENLVLVSGRKAHMESRAGIEIRDEKIKLNFGAPSNRIYSRKSD